MLTVNSFKEDMMILKDERRFGVIYERKNGFWGIRKSDGRILVPYIYEDIHLEGTYLEEKRSYYPQLYILKYKGKWGMIGHNNRSATEYKDTTTYFLLPFKYDQVYPNFNSSHYFFKSGEMMGFVSASDFKGSTILKYTSLHDTGHTLSGTPIFKVRTVNGKGGYVSGEGVEYFKDE